jgi:hypothetical protein
MTPAEHPDLGIPGYGFGLPATAQSPVSTEDLQRLEQTMGWTAEDAQLLLRYSLFFQQHAEKMVDAWRAVIARQPHLSQWFFAPDGNPDEEYKTRVRRRFVRWVVDVAARPHDCAWLDYQEEIGLRHTPAKKSKTDGRHTPPLVPLRYLLGFLPVVIEIRSFLESEISDSGELRALERAWMKAVHLHVVLWTRPYVTDGLW